MRRGALARQIVGANYLKSKQFVVGAWQKKWVRVASALSVPLILVACGSSIQGTDISPGNPKLIAYGDPVPKGGGVYKVGNPYQIAGRWYHPKEDKNYNQTGIASWYGLDFHGRRTANGEIYDMDALSAAHPTLPMPTYARVTNVASGKSIVVRINDRGPYAHDRIIDLSKRAAEELDFTRNGTARVRVQYMGRAPLNGDDDWQTVVQRANDNPVERARTAAPVQASTAPQTPSLGGQAQYVQAGSFRDRASADRLRQQLAGVGDVSITPANVGNLTYYRVRVGPFADAGQAESARAMVEARGIPGPRVVSGS